MQQTDKIKLLITGAGGPSAMAFFNAVCSDPMVELFMADRDVHSSGLYFVPSSHRFITPSGDSENFSTRVLEFCKSKKINAVLPTVDCELAPLANQLQQFNAAGITLLISPAQTLTTCFDKVNLMQQMEGIIDLAKYAVIDKKFQAADFGFPFVAKPRSGSGSRDISIVREDADFVKVPCDGSFMAQEYLPGTEYSVDVYIGSEQQCIACIPRQRIKVDSGVAVISKTVIDSELCNLGQRISKHIGIRYVANIQFKRDISNNPRLLEINPRFPGTMPLTIAAGADMPNMCLAELRGQTLEPAIGYQSLAMVRSWQELFLPTSELGLQSV